jgi:foldase protein PrsA
MYKISHNVWVLIPIFLAIAGLSACGGDSSGVAVAQVGGSSISKATLDHWLPIEAILTYELKPSKPVPSGVVPDPPDFTACVTRLASTPAKLVESGPKPTKAQLKSECRQRYQTLRQAALGFLITAEWMIGEGAEQGVQASKGEIMQRFEQVKKLLFPTEAAFQKYLAITGETVSDQLFRSKVKVLSEKIEQKIIYKKRLSAQQQQSAYAKFYKEFPTKWIARTSCRAGYVIVDCKQYKGH